MTRSYFGFSMLFFIVTIPFLKKNRPYLRNKNNSQGYFCLQRFWGMLRFSAAQTQGSRFWSSSLLGTSHPRDVSSASTREADGLQSLRLLHLIPAKEDHSSSLAPRRVLLLVVSTNKGTHAWEKLWDGAPCFLHPSPCQYALRSLRPVIS